MSQLRLVPKNVHLIREAYDDFLLSREAALLSPRTIEFYERTAGDFVSWLEKNFIEEPSSRDVRAYLTHCKNRGLSDSSVHGFARGVKAFLRFAHAEGYLDDEIKFKMPKVPDKPMPVLNSEEIKTLLKACLTLRDKLVICLLVDTGARRAEAVSINWGDVDLSSGLIRIRRGKGKKGRSVVIGLKTRQLLMKYRRSVSHGDGDPLIQTRTGTRLTMSGLRMVLRRVGERTGIHVSPHVLRRTFATMSLRSGINVLALQALLGHSSLEMVRRYIRLIDDDLVREHRQHGPVDRFLK